MDNLEPITRNEMFLNGDDLEPITREEMILAGADLEPITRHEWFLKKYRGGGGGGGYDLVNIPDLPADIASFNDGTDLPMASLKVTVTPYQDLHGYDAPWVGGAGKNKFNWDAWKGVTVTRGTAVYENNGVTITATDDNAYTSHSNWGDDRKIFVTEGETVTLSWEETTNKQGSIYIFPNDGNTGAVIGNNADVKEISYTVGSGITFITFRFGVKTSGETISYKNIMVRKSGDNAWQPYSNICPIIGWDEAVVTVADDAESPTTSHEYTIDLDGTRYGGVVDVTNGTMDDTLDHIASYNGETLPSTWISDRDVYAEGTTPTIGAEVVYTRATPITVQLAPQPVKSIEGENNISANCGQITEGKYFKRA